MLNKKQATHVFGLVLFILAQDLNLLFVARSVHIYHHQQWGGYGWNEIGHSKMFASRATWMFLVFVSVLSRMGSMGCLEGAIDTQSYKLVRF